MSNLFFHTLSQGLQAFMPIAAVLVSCRAARDVRLSSAVRRGLLAAMPLSFVGGVLFRTSTHQALDEAALAAFAIVMACACWRLLGRLEQKPIWELSNRALTAVSVSSCLIVVRQTLEIASVLQIATIELRSLEATTAIGVGVVTAGVAAWTFSTLAGWLAPDAKRRALATFWVFFIVQSGIYLFHESAEAGLLPWSEVLHAATEPYGPDGLYGVHFSDLLFVAPFAVAGLSSAATRVRGPEWRRASLRRHHNGPALAASLAGVIIIGMQQSDARPPQTAGRASTDDLKSIVARPHVLFRHTAQDANFGALAIVPLDDLEAPRRMAGVTCQRLSYAGGHGLCLHLQRGVFNTYSAILLDRLLNAGTTVKLAGLPSRTRISPDGRVGAITVFVVGDDYAADFSTRTTMIDLAGGDEIGELEQFSTWRNGERFRAVDFNFWGVTFASDGNTFYAALRTAGQTYLVRGELALRRLTVIRENVECPSLSPNNRLLAYKKRVGPSPDSWRIHVLDLQSGAERIVGSEARYIDDQVEWLDDRHVLYGIPRRTTAIVDVWVASIDGSEPPRIFLPQADSPTVVR
jgi:hypothetical protein